MRLKDDYNEVVRVINNDEYLKDNLAIELVKRDTKYNIIVTLKTDDQLKSIFFQEYSSFGDIIQVPASNGNPHSYEFEDPFSTYDIKLIIVNELSKLEEKNKKRKEQEEKARKTEMEIKQKRNKVEEWYKSVKGEI